MAAFVKYSIFFAVLACTYAAPQYAVPAAYPYPPPPAYHAHVVPVVQPHVHVVPHAEVRSAGAAIPIVSQSSESSPDGSYNFAYESADGSSRQESGSPQASSRNLPDGGNFVVQGRYAYSSPEGPVSVEYIADENGYQPSGPSVHPDIQKAVAAQVAQARAEGPIAPAPAAYHVAHAPATYHVAHAPTAYHVGPATAYSVTPGHVHPAVYHPPVVTAHHLPGGLVHHHPVSYAAPYPAYQTAYPTAYPTSAAVTYKA